MNEKLLIALFGSLLFVATSCTPSSDGGSADTGRNGPKDQTGAPSETPSATLASGDEVPPLADDEEILSETKLLQGRANIVKVNNRADGKIKVRTNLQFNRIEGESVTPENVAEVYSSCNGCQSFAVAVQINVYERGASFIVPRNAAIAVNDNCNGCVSIARAYQYVIPVDDVDALPEEVDRLVRAINKEAHYFEQINSLGEVDPAEVQARLNGILAQFSELDAYLTAATAEETEPSGETRSAEQETPTPTLSPAATTTATPSATPPTSVTPSPSPSSSPTAAGSEPSNPTPTPSP